MRIFRWILLGVLIVAATMMAVIFGLYRASQSVPEFYEQALKNEPADSAKAGDELEQQVVELHNDLQQGENWQLVLTDEQINGWLASDLKEKFPGLLPNDLQKPRVAFRDGMTYIACRVNTPRVETVLSLELEAYLTEEPNELAIRIGQVRAGLLPVPLKRVLDRTRDAAKHADIALRWVHADGDPVAIVRVPTDHEDLRPGVVIESVRVEDGRLVVSGTCEPGEFQTLITYPIRASPRFAEDFGSNVNRHP